MLARLEKILPERIPLEKRARFIRWLRRFTHPVWLGSIRRTTPVSGWYGYDRGQPIDRYYIESFLEENRSAIRGQVLEIKDSTYTDRFGEEVAKRDILDIDPANPKATFVADLSTADEIPSDCFDCFLLTQTLQLIYDLRGAVYHAHRILKPGGVLLVTVPSVSRIVPGSGFEQDHWRFTAASCQALFGEFFGASHITVQSYGNVLSAIGFLAGMACEEFSRTELDDADPYFPVVIAVKAVKQ